MTTGIPYQPALEPAELAGLRAEHGHFIDGGFVDPAAGGRRSVHHPATGDPLAEVAAGDAVDIELAVRAARTGCQQGWGRLPGRERAKYLFRLSRLVADRARELAVLTALDTDRPVRRAREVDLPQAEALLFHFAGWADKLRYAVPGAPAPPRPAGVAGLIPPATLPGLLRQLAPALAAGSTVVLTPPPAAPLLALRFAELCRQAELPPATVNVVTGDETTVDALAAQPDLDVLAYTGSAEAARRIARAPAGTRSRFSPTLTGPPVQVILTDAPVEQALVAIVDGLADHVGGRLLLPESDHERLVAELRSRLARLRLGDPTDRNTELGPIGDGTTHERLTAAIETATADGARHWTSDRPLPTVGWWVPPTLLTEVYPGHRVTRAELPGPVAAVLTFRTADEALALATDSSAAGSVTVWSGTGPAVRTPAGLRGPAGSGSGLAAYLAD